MNNLPGSLLRAPAFFAKDTLVDAFPEDDRRHLPECNSLSNVVASCANILQSPAFQAPSSSAEQPPTAKKKKIAKVPRKWIKKDITTKPTAGRTVPVPDETLRMFQDTPTKILELFLDDEVVDLIVVLSNLYASGKGTDLRLTSTEFKCFLGIIFLSGYVAVPRRRMFWEKRSDAHNVLVSEAMRRNRFEAIFSYLQVADNANLHSMDKFAKLRPLINILNERCMKYVPDESCFSVDKSMVPYYGRHGCKQYIRGKPIRFGWKFWCGATRLGYVCWFQPYQGKNPNAKFEEYGVGASVVLEFSEALTKAHPGQYHFVFDNFFTSVALLDKLSSMGHQATGTIRNNRVEKAPLESDNVLRKKERGAYDFRSYDKGNIVCKWHDNSVATVASTAASVRPLTMVNRHSHVQKKKIQVQQPNMIKVYNMYMGGVDRVDENIGKYRSSIRGKK